MIKLDLLQYRAFNKAVGTPKMALAKSLVSLSLVVFVLGFASLAQAEFRVKTVAPQGTVLTVTSPEYLNAAGCLKDDYVADVLKDFDVQFEDSVEDMTIESCDSKSLSFRIALALIILKHGKYNQGAPSKDQSFENLFSTMSPYTFLKRWVKTIKVNDCKRAKFAWAYVIPGDDVVNICAKKMKEWDLISGKKISAIRIASLVVHEARHLDKTIPGHEVLPKCFHCDTSVETKGAFFFEKEFLYNIHKYGSNFTSAERNDARHWAEFLLDNNFVKRAVLDRAPRLLKVK